MPTSVAPLQFAFSVASDRHHKTRRPRGEWSGNGLSRVRLPWRSVETSSTTT